MNSSMEREKRIELYKRQKIDKTKKKLKRRGEDLYLLLHDVLVKREIIFQVVKNIALKEINRSCYIYPPPPNSFENLFFSSVFEANLKLTKI